MADNSLLFRRTTKVQWWSSMKGSSSHRVVGRYSENTKLLWAMHLLKATPYVASVSDSRRLTWIVENKVEYLVSFCVQWTELKDPEKPKSGTAWSGQVIWDEENQRYLMSTLWVLTSKHLFHNVWKATTIEKDIFLPLW